MSWYRINGIEFVWKNTLFSVKQHERRRKKTMKINLVFYAFCICTLNAYKFVQRNIVRYFSSLPSTYENFQLKNKMYVLAFKFETLISVYYKRENECDCVYTLCL